jgi:hypothetical protein
MGKLIATTQATVDGVERDLLEGDLDDSIPKLKTEVDGDLFMHGSGEFSYALAERGLTDEYEVHVNPIVWGEGNLHVLGDRGPVRLRLEDVKRFESGVVLLTYLPGVLIAAVPGSSSISAGSDARPRSGLSSIRVRASKYTYDVTRATKGMASA